MRDFAAAAGGKNSGKLVLRRTRKRQFCARLAATARMDENDRFVLAVQIWLWNAGLVTFLDYLVFTTSYVLLSASRRTYSTNFSR